LNRIVTRSLDTDPVDADRVDGADPFSVLSIGALSHATGVPVETLRTWERRYGFPRPAARLTSGHRRYPIDTVERVRLVVRAIEHGHKPSIALRANFETLMKLIAVAGGPRPGAATPPGVSSREGTFVERCLAYTADLDGASLKGELARAWTEEGPLPFLLRCIGPLLDRVGECWERGDIEVGEEHFASEHIREFLVTRWRDLSEHARTPRVVCATVADEHHTLGLHVAATALALGGAHIVFLGGPTPPNAIAHVVARQLANAVILSASTSVNRRLLASDCRALQKALPPRVPIIVGGAGFDPPPDGALLCTKIDELAEITRTLARRSA
jgi:methanogenic corrinoid protein MtbC1